MSTDFEAERNRASAGFAAPPFVSRPLCQALVWSSRKMNQTNMSTRGSFFASPIACVVYEACWARETPFGSPSCFVSCPYSVIQIRTFLRLNHLSSDCSKRGSEDRVTFGHFTFCVGFRF